MIPSQSGKPLAFTTLHQGPATALINDVRVISDTQIDKVSYGNYPAYKAMWDTGAFSCAISPRVIKSCGLEPVGYQPILTAGGKQIVKLYLVHFILPNMIWCLNAKVLEIDLEFADVLIGMDIISRGDFAISQDSGNTLFSFRVPSQGPIDFTGIL